MNEPGANCSCHTIPIWAADTGADTAADRRDKPLRGPVKLRTSCRMRVSSSTETAALGSAAVNAATTAEPGSAVITNRRRDDRS